MARVGAVEIRTYGERIAAQTVVTGTSEAALLPAWLALALLLAAATTAWWREGRG